MNTRAQARYLVGPFVDFALGGGGSVLAFIALFLLSKGRLTREVETASYVLAWIINWPHFAATAHRLYGSRAHLFQYPITAALSPVIVVAGAAAGFAWPELVAPLVIKWTFLWSAYHYCGQTKGIGVLYAKRAGYVPGRPLEVLVVTFVYLTAVVATLRAEIGTGLVVYGVRVMSLGFPLWPARCAELALYITAAAAIALGLARGLSGGGRPPLMYVTIPLAQYTWFVLALPREGYSAFVPASHGLQYCLVAWVAQRRAPVEGMGVSSEAATLEVWRETAQWYSAMVLLGGALFFALPRFVGAATGSAQLATVLVLSCVQWHHFLVDGVIWKLRRRSVASALAVEERLPIIGRSRAAEAA